MMFPTTVRLGRAYRSAAPNDGGVCAAVLIAIVLVAVPIVVVAMEISHRSRILELENLLTRKIVVPVYEAKDGDIVHVQGQAEAMVFDEPFGVRVAAATLERRTEYCQWQEMRTTSCDRCEKDGQKPYDCNCVTRISYLKSWLPYRVPSLFFDQPGSHHNPQYDPFPSKKILGTVRVDGILLGRVLANLRAKWRDVSWTLGGVDPRYVRWPRSIRFEPLGALVERRGSGFVYAGNGYFFKAYQQSTAERLTRLFVQYLEGSLLDWQFGDLVPSCAAGDIRISYRVQDPGELSVLGPLPLDDGIAHAGRHAPDVMVATEATHARWTVAWSRLFLVLWAFPASILFGAALGKNINVPLSVLGLVPLFLAATWTILWGVSPPTLLLSIFGVLAAAAATRVAAPNAKHRGGSPRAVWRMLARWANISTSRRHKEVH